MKNKIKEVEKRVAIAFCKEMKDCLKTRDFHFKLVDVSDLNLTWNETDDIDNEVIEVKYNNNYYMIYLDCDKTKLSYSL